MNFWSKLDRVPPFVARLLARHPYGAALTDAEIAQASGLAPAQVQAIALNRDWRGVDLPTARAFLMACRVDPCNRRQWQRAMAYVRVQKKLAAANRPGWRYLRKQSA